MIDSYKPGTRLHYEEEHGHFEVEVIRNISDDKIVGYELKVLRTISPAARGLKFPKDHVFTWSNPRDQDSWNLGPMEGLLEQKLE
ncbi:MAG: hypothetical protein AABX10_00110 [Nanoarchaeota archaeon]